MKKYNKYINKLVSTYLCLILAQQINSLTHKYNTTLICYKKTNNLK